MPLDPFNPPALDRDGMPPPGLTIPQVQDQISILTEMLATATSPVLIGTIIGALIGWTLILEVMQVGIDTTRAQEQLSCTNLRRLALALMDNAAFNQAAWNNATPAGREDILRNFFARLNTILGIAPRQAIAFDDLLRPDGGNPSGTYNIETGQITINNRYLQDSDNLDTMRTWRSEAMYTVIHEARHEFQHSALLNHNRFTVSLETRNHWDENFDNYIRGGAEHYAQPIEWDAWNFEGSGDRIRPALEAAGLTPVYEGSWTW